jgi:antirestriction protein ArdC
MPKKASFGEAEMYYSVLFHELIHATGHESRLDREAVTSAQKFGSLTYSQEELTAEIGAAYLCKITGIELPETFENSVAYLQSWLEQLRKNKRFIFKAAAEAKTATQFILGK